MEFVHNPKQVIGKVTDIFADPYGVTAIVERLNGKGANEMSNNENWSYEKDAPSFERQFSALYTIINASYSKEDVLENLRLLERSVKSICQDYDKFRSTAKERTLEDYRLRQAADASCTPNRIWFNRGKDGLWYTTVEWMDGTKTTVGCPGENEEDVNAYTGFCCALAKKLYGSTSKSTNQYVKALWKVGEPKREKEEMRADQKLAAEVRREAEKLKREELIRKKMEEIRITNEAHSRWAKEMARRETAMSEEA